MDDSKRRARGRLPAVSPVPDSRKCVAAGPRTLGADKGYDEPTFVAALRHRGQQKVPWIFTFTSAAYNLVRLRTLLTPVAA